MAKLVSTRRESQVEQPLLNETEPASTPLANITGLLLTVAFIIGALLLVVGAMRLPAV